MTSVSFVLLRDMVIRFERATMLVQAWKQWDYLSPPSPYKYWVNDDKCQESIVRSRRRLNNVREENKTNKNPKKHVTHVIQSGTLWAAKSEITITITIGHSTHKWQVYTIAPKTMFRFVLFIVFLLDFSFTILKVRFRQNPMGEPSERIGRVFMCSRFYCY